MDVSRRINPHTYLPYTCYNVFVVYAYHLCCTGGGCAGDELLIDYGSSKKGMYRFARTYGFIDTATTGSSNFLTTRNGRLAVTAATDILRVAAAAPASETKSKLPLPSHRLQDNSAVTAEPQLSSRAHTDASPGSVKVDGAGGCASAGTRTGAHTDVTMDVEPIERQGTVESERVESEKAGGNDFMKRVVGDFELVVDLTMVDRILADERSHPGDGWDGDRRSCSSPGDAISRDSCCQTSLLQRTMRRYPTTLDEDLDILRGLPRPGSKNVGDSKRERRVGGCDGEGEGSKHEDARVEWERMCVRVRAAEKVAILTAIAEGVQE